jgi:foldase protein PrsA
VLPRRSLRLLACALVAATLLAACGKSVPPAASIDGDGITDTTVALNVRLFSFLASLNNTKCGTPVDAKESQVAACTRFALSSLIQEHFIGSYAAAHKITVSQTDVAGIVSKLEQSFGGAPGLDKKLAASKVSKTELEGLARRILLFQAVSKAVSTASLTDAELQKSYQQNILQYKTIHAEHILVKTKAEAEQVYKQVTAKGATEQDFLALAKKVSIDPSAAQNSGDLGSAPASQFVAEFSNAAVALKPGEISKPVQSQVGWHVIRLVSKQVTPFEQAKDQVIQNAGGPVFQAWLTRQMKAATISVNPKYGVFDTTKQEVVPVRSTSTSSGAPGTGAPSGSGSPAPAAS